MSWTRGGEEKGQQRYRKRVRKGKREKEQFGYGKPMRGQGWGEYAWEMSLTFHCMNFVKSFISFGQRTFSLSKF